MWITFFNSPLWCLLLRHNNDAREQNPIPQQTHLSRSSRATTHGKPIVFFCWLSLGLFNCPKLVFCDHTVPVAYLDRYCCLLQEIVRPSFLSSERRIGKARTMAPKDVDTASFVFCSHWYVPSDVHHIQNLGTAGLSFSYIPLSFCVFMDFWGLCRFRQKPNFASGCVFLVFSLCFFLFCLRAWNISRIGGLCFLTFCIRRGIENFLNFQVVFDLIIQKKIWPAHQRLFAILTCKTNFLGRVYMCTTTV